MLQLATMKRYALPLAAGLGLGFVTGCSAESSPQTPPSMSAEASPGASTPLAEQIGGAPVIDIGAAALRDPIPPRVGLETMAVVRVRTEVQNAGARYIIGASGVRFDPYEYVTAGQSLINNDGDAFTPVCGTVRVAQEQARGVVVEDLARAGGEYNAAKNAGWLQTIGPSTGQVASIAKKQPRPGDVVYAAGYEASADVPLERKASQAIYSAVYIGEQDGFSYSIEDIGDSYGEQQAIRSNVAMNGGGIFKRDGTLAGVIVGTQDAPRTMTVAKIEDMLGVRVVDKGADLPDARQLHIVASAPMGSQLIKKLADNSEEVAKPC